MELFLFIVAAAGTLVTAGAVVFARSPLRGALSLILSLCFLAVLFILLDAAFVAAMQILVYAGAIMVLFLFVIMLLNLQPGEARPIYLSISKLLGGAACIYFAVRVAQGALLLAGGAGGGKAVDGSVKAVGTLMLTNHLFAFEAIGVLLLVAIVGPVVLGMKRLT